MPRRLHRAGAGLVAAAAAVVAVLVNTSVTAGGRVARFESARAAIALSDAVALLAGGTLAVGIGVGLVLGGFWAYHGEVADR